MPIFFSKSQNFKRTALSLSLTLLVFGLAACAPNATPVPTPLPTLVASLTATTPPDISAAVDGTLTALAPIGPTPTDITLTPTDTPEATAEATDDSIVVTLPALAGHKIPPPLTITLPENWQTVLTDVQVLPDVDSEIRGFPIEVYHGAVTGGTATIVLYWGFPNLNLASSAVIAADAQGMAVQADIWSDGLRLLNLAVVEQGCTVGTDLRRTYRIGLLSGVGTQFSAVNCPELPPTRGWFVAVQEKGLNFVFYVYVEGEDVMDNQNLDAFRAASAELQAILDTVRFNVPDITQTATSSP